MDEGNKVVLVTGRSPAYTKNVFEVLGQEVDVIGMNGAYTIVAVSYTHLDVYKRQKLRNRSSGATKCCY